MTLADWIANYDRLKPIFRSPATWLKFLRIVAAGEDGIRVRDLRRGADDLANPNTLAKWERAGIVIRHRESGKIGAPVTRVRVTDKGMKLVGVSFDTVTPCNAE